MNRDLRLFLAILFLAVSISLLAWGYLPNVQETHTLFISSSQMQLPSTP
ncbi:MAG: hypothetical protein JNM55_10760 [Anaerolineales bacterium]|nr:hypothetical protein [Anaerolineales bacterium]